eukprot:15040427-Alexandrium_andersonii.AAC.1
MMRGAAVTWNDDGTVRSMSNQSVMKHWRVADTFTELRVRRLRMYQRWAARPRHFVQALAAVFGTTMLEKTRGYHCMNDYGCLTDGSTPWAVQ